MNFFSNKNIQDDDEEEEEKQNTRNNSSNQLQQPQNKLIQRISNQSEYQNNNISNFTQNDLSFNSMNPKEINLDEPRSHPPQHTIENHPFQGNKKINIINTQQHDNHHNQFNRRRNPNRLQNDSNNNTWAFGLIIVAFFIALLCIFASFIGIVIEQTKSIKGPHYEIIQQSKSNNGIYILASCKKCNQYYGNPENPIATHLNMTVKYLSDTSFEFFLKGINFTNEYELPYTEPFTSKVMQHEYEKNDFQKLKNINHTDSGNSINSFEKESQRNYFIAIRENPLEMIVKRKYSDEIIFKFSSLNLIYSQQFKSINVTLPTQNLYGLGERMGKFKIQDGNYTLWSQKQMGNNTEDVNLNYNSFHPLYLQKEIFNTFHLVYIRTSNALQINKQDQDLIINLIGGSLNLVIFMGNGKAQKAIQDYHYYLGGFQKPPLWSLGIQHYYDKIDSLEEIQYLIKNYTQNSLVLDVLWIDQNSYIYNSQAFNFDYAKFPPKNFSDILKDIYVIPTMQSGINIVESVAYIEGVRRNIFIKDKQQTALSGTNNLGKTVLYPDFFSSQIYDYWNEMLGSLYTNLQFDGVYFYDNEITDYTQIFNKKNQNNVELIQHKHQNNDKVETQKHTFQNYNGQENNLNRPNNNILDSNFINKNIQTGNNINQNQSTNQQKYFYKFIPNQDKLQQNTISFSAQHEKNISEFNTHNVFGYMQQYATYLYLSQWAKKPLPFIISKSTFPGSGKYGGHLASLPGCDWKSLQSIVPSLLNFNMFGIPMTGYGVCFENEDNKSIDQQLISRWLQLSAVLPFFITRSDSQNLPIFSETFLLKQMIKIQALRYQLRSIYQPLFFQYQHDDDVFLKDSYTNEQFLIGNDLMICPILQIDTIVIQPYFPQDDWFDFFTGIQVKVKSDPGGEIRIQADISADIPIFIRGGSVIPLQNYESQVSLMQQDTNFTLVIAFTILENGQLFSKGYLLGKSNFGEQNIYQSCVEQNCLIKIEVTATTIVERPPKQSYYDVKFTFTSLIKNIILDPIKIQKFKFFNLQQNVLEIQDQPITIENGNKIYNLQVLI